MSVGILNFVCHFDMIFVLITFFVLIINPRKASVIQKHVFAHPGEKRCNEKPNKLGSSNTK